MFTERHARGRELQKRLGDSGPLRYPIDVGHALCNEEAAPEEIIQAAGDQIAHIQIEDMRRGVHQHLPFGEGELDLTAAVAALLEIDYQGLVSVELARNSPTAPVTAAATLAALQQAT